jgi:hypothetical protein
MYVTERLALKVLQRDKEALRRLAAAEGEAMSVVVRRLIRQAARERGLWPPVDQHSTTEAAQHTHRTQVREANQ